MDQKTLFLGDFIEPMSDTHTLDPECFAQLKTDGLFMHKVHRYNEPLDLSSHVAAQNAHGWIQRNAAFVPHGSSHSALILNNIQFSIPKSLFKPLHKSPQVGSHENQKEQ